jgi:glycosyltransferase involved in cell wall biosynthesis
MTFFSIIIPTFNRAGLITETINSLLKQTFQDFEIIVVDDGSNDNTEEVVSLVKTNRVRYIKKENGERGVARNFGARLAKGEYLNFFDSDDLAYENHLETAFHFLKNIEKNCEVFHTAYDIQKDGMIKPAESNLFDTTINENIIIENFLSCNNVFIRKDIALENPFPEDRRMAVAEDWALWLVLSSKYKFYHYNTVTSTIVYHDNRSVFDFNVDKIILRDKLLIEYLMSVKSFVLYYRSSLKMFKGERYTFMALFLALKKRKKESLKFLFQSLSFDQRVLLRKRFWGTIKTIILQ